MNKIGILHHPLNKASYSLAEEIEKFLTPRGISTWLCSAWEEEKAKAQVNGTEMILSIGGDGTILRATQVAVPHHIPITGINLGKLGFMTELGANEALEKLPSLIAGEGWIDERAMLEAELESSGPPARFFALNDVVMARGIVAKVIDIEASIDGKLLTNYRSDGVIVATATGSTGYSLAAGGPILHPQANEFIMLPILPHLSLAYSLVLQSTAVVKLQLSTTHQGTFSIDGNINHPLDGGASITIKNSNNKARFLRIHPQSSFYSTLEERLKGKRHIV